MIVAVRRRQQQQAAKQQQAAIIDGAHGAATLDRQLCPLFMA